MPKYKTNKSESFELNSDKTIATLNAVGIFGDRNNRFAPIAGRTDINQTSDFMDGKRKKPPTRNENLFPFEPKAGASFYPYPDKKMNARIKNNILAAAMVAQTAASDTLRTQLATLTTELLSSNMLRGLMDNTNDTLRNLTIQSTQSLLSSMFRSGPDMLRNDSELQIAAAPPPSPAITPPSTPR